MMANYQEKCCINDHFNADTLNAYFADKRPRVHKKKKQTQGFHGKLEPCL